MCSCEQEETFKSQNVPVKNYLTTSSKFLEEPLCNQDDNDLRSFEEAFARVLAKQEQMPLERITAQDLNISNQLYRLIYSIIKNSEIKVTRSNPLKPNSDCVPLTIAFLHSYFQNGNFGNAKKSDDFWQLYDSISKYIYAYYGAEVLTWDEFGCNYETLLQECFNYCRKERFFREEYNPQDKNATGRRCLGIAVIKTAMDTTLHSVIIFSIKNNNLIYFDPSAEKYLYCPSSAITCIYYVTDMKKISNIVFSLHQKTTKKLNENHEKNN